MCLLDLFGLPQMTKGVAAATPCYLSAPLLRVHRNRNRVLDAECQRRLRADDDLLVARHRARSSTAAATDQSAEERPLAAARKSADQSARPGTAANKAGRALALATDGAAPGVGINLSAGSIDAQARQTKRQYSGALELAARIGRRHRPTGRRTGRH